MDRREVMLRELNLYPLWVRRDVPEPSVEIAGATDASAERSEQSDRHSSAPVENLFEAKPNDEAAAVSLNAGGDSLREFQLQNQGGALGRLDWQELKQKMRECELCKLRAACTQTVAGTGNEQADWMFIGEAPGADEDVTGEPFVGHAGRLLDNMLLSIGLKRSEVYIANVIKCRPAEDRHPHVGEIAACLPYLKRQIDLVEPRIIVALGKTAASALLETDATLGSLRGTVHDYNGTPLIVTFHPAYLLRSPMEKAKAWQDLSLAVETMQALT